MLDREQLNLYPDPEPEKDPLKTLVLELAKKWKEKERKIDLIFFFSACGRHRPALAKLPEPMRAKEEIPMLKEIMGTLDKAGIKFTWKQVDEWIKKLEKIAPKEIESNWKNRKDLY